MKFTHYEAFMRHLREAAPEHLSQIYAVAVSHPYERKKIIEEVTQILKTAQPKGDVQHLSAAENTLKQFYEELMTPSLFSPSLILIYDEIDLLGKKQIDELCDALKEIDPKKSVILGSKKTFSSFDDIKKQLILFDLSAEKPWDRKKRVLNFLRNRIEKEGKKIEQEALEELFEYSNLELEALENELKKLICFVGDKSIITRESLQAVASSQKGSNSWNLAQQLIWEERPVDFSKLHSFTEDISSLLPFLGQVRYHLEMGLQITSYLRQGVTKDSIQKALPKIRYKFLDLYVQRASHLKSRFFKRALTHLFQLEIDLKNRSVRPALLSDQFFCKLYVLKE